jgi:hypothetical protein
MVAGFRVHRFSQLESSVLSGEDTTDQGSGCRSVVPSCRRSTLMDCASPGAPRVVTRRLAARLRGRRESRGAILRGELAGERKTRTEPLQQVAQERGVNAGTVAANYYRTARNHEGSRTKRTAAKTTTGRPAA